MEEKSKAINEGAEYICFPMNGKKGKMLIDMYDIKDIQLGQKAFVQDTKEPVNICLVHFTDGNTWQVPLDDETINYYRKFQEKNNKEEKENGTV